VPLVVITLIPLGIILSLWVVWYRRKSKALASFELEDVSTAYRQVYNQWTKRGPHDKEFPPENLKLTRELGEGAFGVVYQAEALGVICDDNEWTDVAVKQLRTGSNEADDFFREVDFMSKLDHPNIVKLLGVCSQEEPFSMVFEYMDLGDLCGFLREAIGLGKGDNDKEEENPGNQEETGGDEFDEPLLTKEELLVIVKQIAEGMVYISSLHLVHRDLATRNCLVATGLVIKIGDFGMSRNVNESDYYR
jgi:serine/threonine protein kinase